MSFWYLLAINNIRKRKKPRGQNKQKKKKWKNPETKRKTKKKMNKPRSQGEETGRNHEQKKEQYEKCCK